MKLNHPLNEVEIKNNQKLIDWLMKIVLDWHLEKPVNQIKIEIKHLLVLFDENGEYDYDFYNKMIVWCLHD